MFRYERRAWEPGEELGEGGCAGIATILPSTGPEGTAQLDSVPGAPNWHGFTGGPSLGVTFFTFLYFQKGVGQ